MMLIREAGANGASRALVLNATFEPLGLVSTRRALLLVLATKAELVHSTDHVFRSERRAFPEPSVVRLSRYVRVPHDRTVAVNRRTVFAATGTAVSTADWRPRASITSFPAVAAGCTHGTTSWPPAVAATRARRTGFPTK